MPICAGMTVLPNYRCFLESTHCFCFRLKDVFIYLSLSHLVRADTIFAREFSSAWSLSLLHVFNSPADVI